MTRPTLSLSLALLALLSWGTALAAESLAAATTAPPEVAPPAATGPGARTIPLAPAASSAVVPTATTQAAPAAATHVAEAAGTSSAPTAATAASAANAPAPATASTPAAAPVASPAATGPIAMPSPTSSYSGNLPTRGMNMDNVEHIFGAPQEKFDAVGKPPIARWDYGNYVVYFEYNLVLHTVLKTAPFSSPTTR